MYKKKIEDFTYAINDINANVCYLMCRDKYKSIILFLLTRCLYLFNFHVSASPFAITPLLLIHFPPIMRTLQYLWNSAYIIIFQMHAKVKNKWSRIDHIKQINDKRNTEAIKKANSYLSNPLIVATNIYIKYPQ